MEQRLLFSIAPHFASVVTNIPEDNAILDPTKTTVLNQAPQQLVVKFDPGVVIDQSTLKASISLVGYGPDQTFGTVDDQKVNISASVSAQSNEVVVRIADTLTDGQYKISISNALKNTSGQAITNPTSETFDLNYGAQVSAVVPQPVVWSAPGVLAQTSNEIDVYFSNDKLTLPAVTTTSSANATDLQLFQLIATNATVSTNDDGVAPYNPVRIEYNSTTNLAKLFFATSLDLLGSGTGLFRLRIGDNATNGGTRIVNVSTDAASSINDSTLLGSAGPTTPTDPANPLTAPPLGTQTLLLTGGAIQPAGSSVSNSPYDLVYPGSSSDPGQRDIPALGENHIGINAGADSTVGITTFNYNFRLDYGTDAQGNELINQITEQQKQDIRAIFTLYGQYLGVKFVETPDSGFTIATGDVTVLNRGAHPEGLDSIAESGDGIHDTNFDGSNVEAVINNLYDWGVSEFGGNYFRAAMKAVGSLLGLGQAHDLPLGTIMGDVIKTPIDSTTPLDSEPVFPGNADILNAQYIYRPENKDIDLYKFTLNKIGTFSAETIAQRLVQQGQANPSLLNTVITLFDSSGNILARNDDYFGNDSYLSLDLSAGDYYISVTSVGNTNFNANVPDSGMGGTTQGQYDLRLSFSPIPPGQQLMDVGNPTLGDPGQPLDGDLNGVAGGDFNFWFQVGRNNDPASPVRNTGLGGGTGTTLFVDTTAPAGGNGTLQSPLNSLQFAIAQANPGQIIRVVGNHIANDIGTAGLADDEAYEIGRDIFGNALADGATLNVPHGVTLMIDAGAVFKLRGANINAGSVSVDDDLGEGAIQVLGTPDKSVIFTSDNNKAVGVPTPPTNTLNVTPAKGDWGGIVFQDDSDYEDRGIFLNYVAHADITYGGGSVLVGGHTQSYAPITLVSARPTILDNYIHKNANAAISADPDSFEFTLFEGNTVGDPFTADYNRSGPLVFGNVLTKPTLPSQPADNNDINGLFIRIRTVSGTPIDTVNVPAARLSATDIVYVLAENLMVKGTPGGPLLDENGLVDDARVASTLIVDPGVIVKAQGSRIEVGIGAHLIAEGTTAKPITFTSLLDDSYGAGGIFDTTSDGSASTPLPGDWSGFFFNPGSTGSIDYAEITFAGGVSPIEGGFAAFNAVEIYQATVRIADSVLENNAEGFDATNRNGRGSTDAATIYIVGAQPSIVKNVLRKNAGAAISVNANSLTTVNVPDWGRSTGRINRVTNYDDNEGPLVRGNILDSNDINGMEVRGATLDTQTLWDDTDIVHVLQGIIDIPNFESSGGLELKSSPTESLVVKLNGPTSGFTAGGNPLDISNRIGGTLQILGTPGHPVVLTSLADSTVGAGVDLSGNAQVHTLGNDLLTVTTASQMTINFNLGPGFSSLSAADRAAAVAALQFAAQQWEAVLDNPITLSIDVDFSSLGNSFSSNAVVTQTSNALLPYDAVRAAMIARAQGNDTFLQNLPTFAQLQVQFPDSSYSLVNQVSVNRANALALGFDPGALPSTPSAFGGAGPIDATITFNSDFTPINPDSVGPFVYSRNTGVPDGSVDFIASALHGIGVALGFNSAIDSVAAGVKSVALTPLDMFRLAPNTVGIDGADFTTAPRVLVPFSANVFYDGGYFDRASLGGGLFLPGEIPLSSIPGQGANWMNAGLLGTQIPIGVMDNLIYSEGIITQADLRAIELLGYNAVNRGAPGTWNALTLTQYANDRNVAMVNESESSYLPPLHAGTTRPPDQVSNDTPGQAQQLGILAPDLLDGDENRRLGFEVHGSISFNTNLTDPGDSDVYTFSGTAGTPVWFDISNTSVSLDTVLELIDSQGRVLARSDSSDDETADPSLLVGSAGITPLPLRSSSVSGENPDLNTKNTKDAGFRLVLPGTPGTTGTYYIRVRSTGSEAPPPNTPPTAPAFIAHAAQTSGDYTLQIRLQEEVEVAGSTVQFADIRYAQNGIVTQGLPDSSPITSTSTEAFTDTSLHIANTTLNTAQDLGNLLSSDQNILSVSSVLSNRSDVQWFKFTLTYQQIETLAQGGGIDDKTWATVFDIDFANGLSRPDLSLSVFDFLGNLLYISRGSNVADDQPTPNNVTGQSQLYSGSGGALDPFLGSIQLPEGLDPRNDNQPITYYVAISSDLELPKDLDSYFQANATNKLIRLQPVNSQQLIVSDNLNAGINNPTGGGYIQTGQLTNSGFFGEKAEADPNLVLPAAPAILPVNPQFVPNPNPKAPGTSVQQLSLNVVPYTLNDLQLFVSQNGAKQVLSTVNPQSGKVNATIGTLNGQVPTDLLGINDLVVRSDGVMMGAHSVAGPEPNATGGALAAIDPTTAKVFTVGNDAIPDFPDPPPTTTPPPRSALDTSSVQAMAYLGFQFEGDADLLASVTDAVFDPYQLVYAVNGSFSPGGAATQSYLYLGNSATGSANATGLFDGLTGPMRGSAALSGIFDANPGDVGLTTGMSFIATQGFAISAKGADIADGDTFTIKGPVYSATFEFNSTGGVSGTNIPVSFTSADVAATVANSILAAVSTVSNHLGISIAINTTVNGNGPGAIAVGDGVVLSRASSVTSSNGLVSIVNVSDVNLYGVSAPSNFGGTTTGFFFQLDTTDMFEGSNGVNLQFTQDRDITDLVSLNAGVKPGLVLSGTTHNPVPGARWAGLAVGPQNLDLNGDGTGGDLATTLFGITTTGDIYAIDPLTGTLRLDVFPQLDTNGNPVFDTQGNQLFVDHISTGLTGATGLAFAPIDFNLWHPTNQSGADPGHGLAPAPDQSNNVVYTINGTSLPPGVAPGFTSYYFGMEDYNTAFTNFDITKYDPLKTSQYLLYPQNTPLGVNIPFAQYGSLTTESQIDLTRNSLRISSGVNNGLAVAYASTFSGSAQLRQNEMIGNNTNIPGGAHGQLITNSFDLSGSTANDFPTLYFNYYLESQNDGSKGLEGDALKDPVHVYISGDNGATWQMVATSNTKLQYDLPAYISANANTGNGVSTQGMQPLFTAIKTGAGATASIDTTWRQARIDLSNYAGDANVKIKFQVDSGTANNNYKGFSIDDIMVGNAGRGEMVTQMFLPPPPTELPPGAPNPPGTGTTPAPTSDFFGVPQPPSGVPVQVLVGAYQLNIRRGDEYGATLNRVTPNIQIVSQSTPNDRHINGYSLLAPGAMELLLPAPNTIVDGDTFVVSAGLNQLVFEFDVTSSNPLVPTNGINVAGHIGIPVAPGELATTLANSIVQAINARASTSMPINASLDGNGTGVYVTFDPVFRTTTVNVGVNPTGTPGMTYTPQIFSGDTFTVTDGFNSRTFEFGTLNPGDGNIHIPFNSQQGPKTVAANIANAINSQFGNTFDVTAGVRGNGQVNLYGAQQLDPNRVGINIIPPDQTGYGDVGFFTNQQVTTGVSFNPIVADGSGFSLSVNAVGGTQVVNFQYVDSAVTLGNIFANFPTVPIPLIDGAGNRLTMAQLAQQIVDEVNLVASAPFSPFQVPLTIGLNVIPTSTFPVVASLDPVNNQVNITVNTNPIYDSTATDPLGNGPILPTGLQVYAVTGLAAAAALIPPGTVNVDVTNHTNLLDYRFQARGDQNVVRSQGEVIIANNTIRSAANYGIVELPAVRDATNAQQQTASNLVVLNGTRLAPGLVIQNNVIDSAGTGGILISGDPVLPGVPSGIVPFARVINNTIYGAGVGTGITVKNNASPTILNNIVANLKTGISVDTTSTSTVIGEMLYQGNNTNAIGVDQNGNPAFVLAVGSNSVIQPTIAPLFVNAANHNFNLLPSNSSGLPNKAIDSSLQVLQDRPAMTAVENPLGINASQIITPQTDGTGKQRLPNDPYNPPFPGLGGTNPYVDRGALDHSDFDNPTASVSVPLDDSADDLNKTRNSVLYAGKPLTDFEIQLSDGTGSGIDDSTVFSNQFTLTKNGNPLFEGVNYTFAYDSTKKVARFIPNSGVWDAAAVYVITLNNSASTGIKDLASNPLLPTSADNTTQFSIAVQQLSFGSAPVTYKTLLSDDGARHVIDTNGLRLGSSVTASADGEPNVLADNGQPGNGVTGLGSTNIPWVPGSTVQITVNVNKNGVANGSPAGKLDAWIDWNGDGTWEPNEEVFTDQSVVAGNNMLTITVPSVTSANITYARFRLSTAGGLSPTGLATDGEVEDYQVTVQPTAAYSIVLVNPVTNLPLPKDANDNYVLSATSFKAMVYVTDTRAANALDGIAAAFTNLVTDPNFAGLISWSNVSFAGSGFTTQQNSTIATDAVNNAGGAMPGGATPPGSGVKELLFTVTGTLTTATPQTNTPITLSTAAPGTSFITKVFDGGAVNATPVQSSYGSVHFVVSVDPWQFPVYPYDVNADGFVTVNDLLYLVSFYNAGTFDNVNMFALPTAPNAPPPYLDVDGSGIFDGGDIMAEVFVYNHLPLFVTDAEAAEILNALPEPKPPFLHQNSLVLPAPLHEHAAVAPVTDSSTNSQEVTVSIPDSTPSRPLSDQAGTITPTAPLASGAAAPVVTSAPSAVAFATAVSTSSLTEAKASSLSASNGTTSAAATSATVTDSLFANDDHVLDTLPATSSDAAEWTTGSVAQASFASGASKIGSGSAETVHSGAIVSPRANPLRLDDDLLAQLFAGHSEDPDQLDLDGIHPGLIGTAASGGTQVANRRNRLYLS